jgi:peptide/nickel transport system substrate-binding protein
LSPSFSNFSRNDGDKVYTFTIRDGHRWSDGQPFTAEDIRYWWEDGSPSTSMNSGGPDGLSSLLSATSSHQ